MIVKKFIIEDPKADANFDEISSTGQSRKHDIIPNPRLQDFQEGEFKLVEISGITFMFTRVRNILRKSAAFVNV